MSCCGRGIRSQKWGTLVLADISEFKLRVRIPEQTTPVFMKGRMSQTFLLM